MSSGHRAEEGTATAELAVALPSLVLVLAVALGAVHLGLDQVRCVDAARLGARALARGEPEGAVLREVTAAAPPGARVSVTRGDGEVSVAVDSAPPAVLRPLGLLAPVRATAVARVEPGW